MKKNSLVQAVAAVVVALILIFLLAIAKGMPVAQYMQHLVNGISLGSLFALIAIGYTMVYTILRMINFAHGDVFMISMYFAFFAIAIFHLPWVIGFVIAIAMTALVGFSLERFAYRPLRSAPKNSVLISAIGASFLLINLTTYLFTGFPRKFPDIALLNRTIILGNDAIRFQFISIFIPIVAVVALAILVYIINHTKTGMAMRAVATDFEISGVMGVNENRIISLTFIIGSSLAAIGGIMWGIKYPGFDPVTGIFPGVKCFIAAVVGGIGNINGAVLGGLIIGLGEIMIVALFPDLSGYRDAFAFVMLITILMVKPAGLLGTTVSEKV
jgi:branched-chain amino acid transport system permease protein